MVGKDKILQQLSVARSRARQIAHSGKHRGHENAKGHVEGREVKQEEKKAAEDF